MNIAIFYQSVTGNTKHAAQMIERGLKEKGQSCALFDIHNLEFNEIEKYDLIGFGAPTFAWKEPRLMRNFILNLPHLNRKYVFLFSTCAGSEGNFFFRMANNLKKKDVNVFAKVTLLYPNSYTCWRKEVGNDDLIKQTEVEKAINFGSTLVEKYDAIIKEETSPPSMERRWFKAFLGAISSDWALRSMLGTIKVDQEKCTKCGTCVNTCPQNAIILNPYPFISKNLCTGCCGCINVCPVRALDSKKTRNKESYRFRASFIET